MKDKEYVVTWKESNIVEGCDKNEVVSAMEGNYRDVGICMMALDDGESIDTPFAIYRKRIKL